MSKTTLYQHHEEVEGPSYTMPPRSPKSTGAEERMLESVPKFNLSHSAIDVSYHANQGPKVCNRITLYCFCKCVFIIGGVALRISRIRGQKIHIGNGTKNSLACEIHNVGEATATVQSEYHLRLIRKTNRIRFLTLSNLR
jgi:hypothetical protein